MKMQKSILISISSFDEESSFILDLANEYGVSELSKGMISGILKARNH
ncbi:7542_t:CDS:2 [Rhizophagus irregularis]|nr:7542_t:CDS:2 [Rhizophagus irregularis]